MPGRLPPALRRTLLALLLAAAVAEVVYLVGANLFLHTSLGPELLNRRPEKLRVGWHDAGFTWWPGHVTAGGLEIRGQNRFNQWLVTIEHARLDIGLGSLILRRFAVDDAELEGLIFRLRRRADVAARSPAERRHDPPIDGLHNPPPTPPESLYPPKTGPGWTLALDGIEVDGVFEVWVDGWRWSAAEGVLDTSLRLRIRDHFVVHEASARLGPGELTVGGEPAATAALLEVDGQLEQFPVRGAEAARVLDGLSMKLVVDSRLAGLGFLEGHLASAPFLTLEGQGRLRCDLTVEAGALVGPGHLAVDVEPFRVGLFEHVASGAGSIEGTVRGEAAELAARLDRFAIRHGTLDRDYVSGEGLAVTTATAGLRVGHDLRVDRVHVLLPPSAVTDFEVYNVYLPPATGLALRSGRGTVGADVTLWPATRTGAGRVTLDGDGVVVGYRDLTIAGALRVEGRLERAGEGAAAPGGDGGAARPEPFVFDLGGSRARLEQVTVGEAGEAGTSGWWGEVALERGRLTLTRPPSVAGTFTSRMRDATPILAVFAENNRVVEWIDGLVSIEDVSGRAAVASGGEGLALDGLEVTGEHAEIAGRLRLGQGGPRGLLFARYRKLSLAVEMDGERRDWKLVNSRKWFERRLAATETPGD